MQPLLLHWLMRRVQCLCECRFPCCRCPSAGRRMQVRLLNLLLCLVLRAEVRSNCACYAHEVTATVSCGCG